MGETVPLNIYKEPEITGKRANGPRTHHVKQLSCLFVHCLSRYTSTAFSKYIFESEQTGERIGTNVQMVLDIVICLKPLPVRYNFPLADSFARSKFQEDLCKHL